VSIDLAPSSGPASGSERAPLRLCPRRKPWTNLDSTMKLRLSLELNLAGE
jgi:hypothetical protein